MFLYFIPRFIVHVNISVFVSWLRCLFFHLAYFSWIESSFLFQFLTAQLCAFHFIFHFLTLLILAILTDLTIGQSLWNFFNFLASSFVSLHHYLCIPSSVLLLHINNNAYFCWFDSRANKEPYGMKVLHFNSLSLFHFEFASPLSSFPFPLRTLLFFINFTKEAWSLCYVSSLLNWRFKSVYTFKRWADARPKCRFQRTLFLSYFSVQPLSSDLIWLWCASHRLLLHYLLA